MTGHPDDNRSRSERASAIEREFPSTTYDMRRVRITRAPQASGDRVPKGHRWRKLPPRNWRKPLGITVQWRGGAEAWIEVHARGDFARFPGWTPIADIVMYVNSQTR